MPKQSTLHRMQLLADGRCPIHGASMSQSGLAENGNTPIVECSQPGCNIRGIKSGPGETVVLLPEFSHLLDPDQPGG